MAEFSLEDAVSTYEQQERNFVDFDDIRFGEIYLDDKLEEFYE